MFLFSFGCACFSSLHLLLLLSIKTELSSYHRSHPHVCFVQKNLHTAVYWRKARNHQVVRVVILTGGVSLFSSVVLSLSYFLVVYAGVTIRGISSLDSSAVSFSLSSCSLVVHKGIYFFFFFVPLSSFSFLFFFSLCLCVCVCVCVCAGITSVVAQKIIEYLLSLLLSSSLSLLIHKPKSQKWSRIIDLSYQSRPTPYS